MIYGYGRVSTSGQNLDRQIDALKMAGVEEQNIYVEKMTGTKADRPQLSALKAKVVEGDVVLIESLSRLGRSSANLITEMEYFYNKGVQLKSLKECLDFSSASGRMVSHILSIISQFERECLVERVKEGVASARARGRVGGRPKVSEKSLQRALQMYNENTLSISEICSACKIGRSTFYRHLKRVKSSEEYDNEIDLDELG